MADLRGIKKSNLDNNDLLYLAQENTMTELNCHNIGKIIKFYPETQTADIQMQQIKQFNNSYYEPVILTNVPIFIYSNSGAYITLPNPEGSSCILLFMDRDIDAFLETKEMYAPLTTRLHDMTDCIALLSFKTQVDAIDDYDVNALTIAYEGSNIKIKSEIEINGIDNIKIKSPVSVTIDSPDVSTTGNLNVGTGISAIVPCGSTTLTFSNGILTGVS